MNRRDFIRLVAGVPLLGALSVEMMSRPCGYDATGAYRIKSKCYVIGVGDSNVAASMHDTDLLGNFRAYVPTHSVSVDDAGQLVFAATFGLNEANFHWNEMALFANGRCVRRKVIDQGIKRLGQTWFILYKLELLYESA